MNNIVDLVNGAVGGASFAPQAVTATGGGTGLDLGNGVNSTNAILEVGAVTGTAPTLNVKLQESDDNTTWTDIPNGAFTQVTAANQRQAIRVQRSKQYCRAHATVGGTTPSFTLCVEILAQKKYTGAGGGYDRSPST
jgi:hypothetical protein